MITHLIRRKRKKKEKKMRIMFEDKTITNKRIKRERNTEKERRRRREKKKRNLIGIDEKKENEDTAIRYGAFDTAQRLCRSSAGAGASTTLGDDRRPRPVPCPV